MMVNVEGIAFGAATGALCVGGGWSLRSLIRPPRGQVVSMAAPVAQWSVIAALIGYSLFLASRAFAAGAIPVSNVFEAITFFLWCSIAMTFFVTSMSRMPALPTFLLPFLAVMGVLAVVLMRPSSKPAMEEHSVVFFVHMMGAFLGYAAFTIAAITAAMYAMQERQLRVKKLAGISQRLPPLEALERLNSQLLTVGFPLFTVSLALGLYLAHEYPLPGKHWMKDTKVISACITWVAYAVLFGGSRSRTLYGRTLAIATLFAYAAMLFTFLGTSLLLGDVHVNY